LTHSVDTDETQIHHRQHLTCKAS